MRRLACTALLLLPACAEVRFSERAVLWRDPDERPIVQPRPTDLSVNWMGVRDATFLPADRVLALDYGVEAQNVNALDEVPDSSWYRDPRRDSPAARERPRALTAAEMARGVVTDEDLPVAPFVVVKGKTIGSNKGFVMKDARGVQYLVKLDPPGRPNFVTSVEVVVSRLAWACGWRVPADVMLALRRDQLRVAPGATGKDRWDHTIPFGEADLAQLLATTPWRSDGTTLVMASRWLPGTSLGSFAWFGTREDDPNDRVKHEDRRDLRGFGTFAAWVNEIDTMQTDLLDMYEGPPGRGHVVHYQQDVGGAFGVWTFKPAEYWMSHEAYFSASRIVGRLLALGLAPMPWEGERARAEYERRAAESPELAAFTAEGFDPRTWHPVLDNPAFDRQTARDRYWAAKKIAAISEGELRAAISAGQYPPAVAERLFWILWVRRERILRAFFAGATPLDYFRLDGGRLCFDDLWAGAGLGGDRVDAREAGVALAPAPPFEGQACVALPPRAGYRVVELALHREGARRAGKPVRVHLVERDGRRRLLGIER